MYVLLKKPIQKETLKIVRWLNAQGINAQPARIVERNYPEWVTELPSIEVIETEERHVGLRECIAFYQRLARLPIRLETITEAAPTDN